MRRVIVWSLAVAFTAAPLAARADGIYCPDMNVCQVSGEAAAVLAAMAAPVLLAGAGAAVAREMHKPKERPPANLTLLPVTHDRYRGDAGEPERRRQPNAAFQFNESATNVMTAVTGAAVLGAMIATIVEGVHDGGHHK